jgi:hypothetical protein
VVNAYGSQGLARERWLIATFEAAAVKLLAYGAP